MRENERVINLRMQKVQEEKQLMEERLQRAATNIQRHARGMIARKAFKREMEE